MDPDDYEQYEEGNISIFNVYSCHNRIIIFNVCKILMRGLIISSLQSKTILLDVDIHFYLNSIPIVMPLNPNNGIFEKGRTYGGDGYPVPCEEEYYQQEPKWIEDRNDTHSETASVNSHSDKQPMPKESSFFIFSSKNR